jgi:probable rRNA maturation factor
MHPPDEPDSHASLPVSSASGRGDARVRLILRQRRISADWGEVRAFLRSIPRDLAASPCSVCMVSDSAMRRYNETFRHKAGSTDVLSFPMNGASRPEDNYAGDIVISVEMARRNALQFHLRLEDEIKALVLHGLLHLEGHDHESDRGQMARAERRWGARLGLPQTLLVRRGAASRPERPRRGTAPRASHSKGR